MLFTYVSLETSAKQQQIEHKVSKSSSFKKVLAGESLYSIMKREGFEPEEINQILRIDLPLDELTLAQGQIFKKTKSQNFLELKFYQLPSNQVLALWRDKERAGAHFREDRLNIQNEQASGRVDGSILSNIEKSTGSLQLGYRFLDAFAFDMNLQKILSRGDRFELTFEKKFDEGQFIGFGEILEAAVILQDDVHRRHFVKFPFGGGTFVDPLLGQSNRNFFSPVNYVKISSGFNPRRRHPITKRLTPHHGVDFELETGEPVLSVADGQVIRMGKNRAAGLYVVIAHDDGFESFYNHLSRIEANLKKNDIVFSGQRIGEVGCSGYCTKPHLHFALKRAGKYLNPVQYMRSYPYQSKELVAQFIEEKQLL